MHDEWNAKGKEKQMVEGKVGEGKENGNGREGDKGRERERKWKRMGQGNGKRKEIKEKGKGQTWSGSECMGECARKIEQVLGRGSG